jgi:hypothetical protein
MEELWRDIPRFPGYKVSNLGRVSGKRVDILKPQHSKRGGGYPFVDLRGKDAEGNNIRWCANVHTLVANAFLENRPSGMVVHHLDHNRRNACASNLVYVTPTENYRI